MAPAISKSQQKFMGMVLAAKRGEKPASAKVAEAAKSMTAGTAREFAATKRKGLPQHAVMSNLRQRSSQLKERIAEKKKRSAKKEWM